MKKIILFSSLVLMLVSPPRAVSEAQTKVLVLGVSSPVMDEIEERFMREEILRALGARGVAIVPVMKTEEIIRSRNNFNPASVTFVEMEKLARAAGASLVIAGKIECADCKEKRVAVIDAPFSYRCTLTVLQRGKEPGKILTRTRRGEKNRYTFIRAFSRELVTALAEQGYF